MPSLTVSLPASPGPWAVTYLRSPGCAAVRCSAGCLWHSSRRGRLRILWRGTGLWGPQIFPLRQWEVGGSSVSCRIRGLLGWKDTIRFQERIFSAAAGWGVNVMSRTKP